MHKRIIPYLQLIRLPNVVTAAADSLTGWLLVTGTLAGPEHFLPLVGASMALYAAGTALNDVFDFEIDLAERPGRPLPSGQVSRSTAAWLGGLGLLAGTVLACASGSVTSAIVAAVLAGSIMAYDARLKQTWLGPAFMGACRGLNLLLGMSHEKALGGVAGWWTALVYGSYVAGITIVSRSESSGGQRGGLVAGLALQDFSLVGLAAAALLHQRFPQPDLSRPLIPLAGLLVLALAALALNTSAARAIQQPIPRFIQATVKTGILSLVWLHVGVVAAVRGLEPAALVAVLWVPAYVLGRWLYST
jgi:4-hydroxybenzoate polyprenyltransferase